MRDPERLDKFYETLKELHKTNFPDWRFAQLIYNFLRWAKKDIFYWEEDKFLDEFEKFIKIMNGNELNKN